MIKRAEFVEYRYTEADWSMIKDAVPDALRHEIDQSRRSVEVAVTMYLPQAALNRQRLSRDELIALRNDAESLRARIDRALAKHLNIENTPWAATAGMKEKSSPHAIPRPGVSHDMLDATSDYFAKLSRTLDGQIEKAKTRTRRDNASKPERDEFWTSLLLFWIDIGGKPTGRATARFLIAASEPVGADESIKTVVTWLDRQKDTISKIVKDVRSVVGPRRQRTRRLTLNVHNQRR